MANAKNLLGMYKKPMFLDAEIKNAILMPGEEYHDDCQYCEGFEDFENMGISSVVTMQPRQHQTNVYMNDNMGELQQALDEADLIVSFNGVNFDAPLLKANDIHIDDRKHYDLLREMWTAEGHDPDVFKKDTHTGYGLNATCKANGLQGKIGHGALAPVQFQRAQYGGLITYNIDDVSKLVQLVRMACRQNGYLVNPRGKQKKLFVTPPFIPCL